MTTNVPPTAAAPDDTIPDGAENSGEETLDRHQWMLTHLALEILHGRATTIRRLAPLEPSTKPVASDTSEDDSAFAQLLLHMLLIVQHHIIKTDDPLLDRDPTAWATNAAERLLADTAVDLHTWEEGAYPIPTTTDRDRDDALVTHAWAHLAETVINYENDVLQAGENPDADCGVVILRRLLFRLILADREATHPDHSSFDLRCATIAIREALLADIRACHPTEAATPSPGHQTRTEPGTAETTADPS